MGKIFNLIRKERDRQNETLMMIPSENYTYPEVRKAVGSILMHKYAEGQPSKRYYNGNIVVDEIEKYCEDLALKAFNLSADKWFANVQPLSGTPANLAVYNALLSPGDKILSMFLPDGGHLSHGWHTENKNISFVSKIYDVQFYKVDSKTRVFDYEQIERQALKFKPKLIVSGGTAYPREINHGKLAQIAKKTGSYYLADIAHEAGLIVAGVNTNPFPYADVVTLTTHKTLRGPRGAIIIGRKELEGDVDSSVFPGLQGGPHMHTIAGIAVALEKSGTAEFIRYARRTVDNAKVLATELKNLGFDIVSGGTDKHLVLIDLRGVGSNGWIVGHALEAAGIIVNRNTVPLETSSPYYPSGIRIGTPALSVRKMGESEMKSIARKISQVVDIVKDIRIPKDAEMRIKFTKEYLSFIAINKDIVKIRKDVRRMCERFPVDLT